MKANTLISHYEILTALGKGGMGEAWTARDTKHWVCWAEFRVRVERYGFPPESEPARQP